MSDDTAAQASRLSKLIGMIRFYLLAEKLLLDPPCTIAIEIDAELADAYIEALEPSEASEGLRSVLRSVGPQAEALLDFGYVKQVWVEPVLTPCRVMLWVRTGMVDPPPGTPPA